MSPQVNDALLIIDVQNDFCPGGALAVQEGDQIIPIINQLQQKFSAVILTQDWHPKKHLSFASSHEGKKPFEEINLSYGAQTLWPDHCIIASNGAKFHKSLHLKKANLIVRKGFRREIDSYSAFFENDRKTPTGLSGYLNERGITRLFMTGLAYDYCVRYSALDARRLGFTVTVIVDATRAINLNGSAAETNQLFEKNQISVITSDAILK